MSTAETEASGWDAIEQALAGLYGEQEPKHYGTLIPYALGGPDPLRGISVYSVDAPSPHWHFVTYGFTELDEKESDDSSISGYGFELTFRLRRGENEEEPPAWALNLLQNMGRYVFRSGNAFRAGDYMDANGPICLGADTLLTALAFIADPALPAIETPNGTVAFLQMVGITGPELQAVQVWNSIGFLQACEPFNPMQLTDLERSCFLDHRLIEEAVAHGNEQDGSSTGYLYVDQLGWEPAKKKLLGSKPAALKLGAKQAETIGKLLKGRLLKGKSLTLSSSGIRVVLQPGEIPGIVEAEQTVRITLNAGAVVSMAAQLQAKAGNFAVPAFKGISLQIVPTEIKDQNGRVVQTIG